MPERDDHELLTDFTEQGAESAFAVLVSRYVNLVHSAGIRYTGNSTHAEEITQAVFIILARKAGKLGRGIVLSGWLYQTARLTSANFMKGEARRQQREQEAHMQSTLNEATAPVWDQLAPILDEAMGTLGETDRNTLVMRFFENKTAIEVAAAMKTTEASAHKRTQRALEKLRNIFSRRGVSLTATLLAGVLSTHSIQAAPVGFAATVSTTALKGTALSLTLTALVKGTMKTMTGLKLKFAAGLAAGALLVGGLATVAVSETVKNNKPSAQAILKQSMETYSELTSYSDEGNIVSMIGSNRVAPHTFTTQLGRPNLYRIEWKQDSGFFVSKGMAWSEGNGDYVKILEQRKPELLESRDLVLDTATGISGGAASSVPRAFFESSGGNRFSATMSAAVREADEIAGGVDCYVLSQSTAGRKRRVWIGKQDHLIRQIENTTSAKVLKPLLEDAEKRRPQNQGPLPSSLVKGDSLSVETHTNIVVNAILTQKSFVP